PLTALTTNVSAQVVGQIYDCGAHIVNGVQSAWQAAGGRFRQFFHNAREGVHSMASWNTLVRLPLAIKQHPKFTYSILITLSITTYWSVATSLELNDKNLGDNSRYFMLPTIIYGMLFNSFSIKPLIYDLQKLGVRLFGSLYNKNELRLEDFLNDLMTRWDSYDAEETLQIFNELACNSQEGSEIIEKYFFSNRSPADIFGKNHRFAQKANLTDVIKTLTEETSVWPKQHRKNRHSQFFAKPSESTKLLSKDYSDEEENTKNEFG
ncbi:MAG: hypothetical protein M3R00_08595, partial [Pseudomonadota bacterium]|nr:hypothetical protein [Pseudomonadota bacterium]